MARDDEQNDRTDRNSSASDRDRYRDDDDARDPLPPEQRVESKPDTRFEARGDARENVGNTARGTDTHRTGPEGNDNTRGRPGRDEFDEDLARDDRKSRE